MSGGRRERGAAAVTFSPRSAYSSAAPLARVRARLLVHRARAFFLRRALLAFYRLRYGHGLISAPSPARASIVSSASYPLYATISRLHEQRTLSLRGLVAGDKKSGLGGGADVALLLLHHSHRSVFLLLARRAPCLRSSHRGRAQAADIAMRFRPGLRGHAMAAPSPRRLLSPCWPAFGM